MRANGWDLRSIALCSCPDWQLAGMGNILCIQVGGVCATCCWEYHAGLTWGCDLGVCQFS